jgi:hypothetical protein
MIARSYSKIGAALPRRRIFGATLNERSRHETADSPRSRSGGPRSTHRLGVDGRIKFLVRRGSRYELRFDPAWLLTGYTASRAAREDTGSGDVPNDNYTRDETHKLLAYLVPATTKVTILTHGTCSTHVTMARLARAVPTAGFWIQIRNDVVTSIDQQYHP